MDQDDSEKGEGDTSRQTLSVKLTDGETASTEILETVKGGD